MKKKVKSLLRYLEVEANIDIDFSNSLAPEIFTDTNGCKYGIDIIFIGNPICMFKIISSLKRGEKKILQLELLYGNAAALLEAKNIRQKLKSVIPSIPVIIKHLMEDGQLLISKKINISEQN